MGRTLRILIIDDDEDAYVILHRILERLGRWQVSTTWVRDYAEGLEYLTRSDAPFEACFVDLRLGLDSGVDLVRAATERGCLVPIILLTAAGAADTDIDALRAGAADYLEKTHLEPLIVERTIRYAIERSSILKRVAASAKMSMIGEMSVSIAHEINTPIAIVRGLCFSAAQALESATPDVTRAKEACAGVDAAAGRIAQIVRGLLAFASSERPHEPRKPVEIKRVIDDCLAVCAPRFKQAGVMLNRTTIQDSVVVLCREGEVSQILLNLLANAYDAVASRPDPWIEIRASEGRDHVEVRVIDSGAGIPPEHREKIMAPFFTTKEAGKGTGLGLSISRRLAEAQSGSLRLDESSPFTTFCLRLAKPGT